MKRVLVVFGLAAIIMLGVFRFAGWYSDNAALPRYCRDPGAVIAHVRKLLSSPTPAGNEKRRPYLVAAKLIFLVPQQDGEPNEDYLERLYVTISERCGSAY